jgi:hypothetical protein
MLNYSASKIDNTRIPQYFKPFLTTSILERMIAFYHPPAVRYIFYSEPQNKKDAAPSGLKHIVNFVIINQK